MENSSEIRPLGSESTNQKAADQKTSSSTGGKRAGDDSIESPRGRKWAKPDHNERKKGRWPRKDKGKDMGRSEYFREKTDKRVRNENEQKKKQDADGQGKAEPIYSTKFSKEEIASEDRRPKRKVAVLIGYSGSGYRGMQIMPNQKTIEGDLFQAFVKAGAISKANANDPKKSQLVRCARTDKGVHAAGNVVSLKLIIEDADIVQKINQQLPPQIRVWGIERTTGSFSCYSECDSRRYEYLIPSHAFLPPHPSSWMAKQLKKIGEEDGEIEAFNDRQKEVRGFWEGIEAERVQPILESLDQDTRSLVEQAIYHTEVASVDFLEDDEDVGVPADENGDMLPIPKTGSEEGPSEDIRNVMDTDTLKAEEQLLADTKEASVDTPEAAEPEAMMKPRNSEPIEVAIKAIKAVYINAKNEYRIPPERLARVNDVLSRYAGTKNFHNFTVKKNAKDPSAKRFIRAFEVDGDPVIINGTEWLSLKVHGQSFMMHQIRKMVAMAALIVRCGCPPDRLKDALTPNIYNIPKAPSLGLLLERPIFETYNKKAAGFEKNDITFAKYEKEMLEFKQREIYDKIFQVEAQDHVFHTFFAQIDNFRMPHFLYLSSRGFAASKGGRTTIEPQDQSLSRKQRKENGQTVRAARTWGRPDDESDAARLESAVKTGAVGDEEKAANDTIHEDASVEQAAQGSG